VGFLGGVPKTNPNIWVPKYLGYPKHNLGSWGAWGAAPRMWRKGAEPRRRPRGQGYLFGGRKPQGLFRLGLRHYGNYNPWGPVITRNGSTSPEGQSKVSPPRRLGFFKKHWNILRSVGGSPSLPEESPDGSPEGLPAAGGRSGTAAGGTVRAPNTYYWFRTGSGPKSAIPVVIAVPTGFTYSPPHCGPQASHITTKGVACGPRWAAGE